MAKSKSKGRSAAGRARPAAASVGSGAESYHHPTADAALRPDAGAEPQFRKKKPPVTYRYDSSLSPALDFDGQNPAREQGEALIRQIMEAGSLEEAKAAAGKLKALGKPFLNWSGKAERLSFDVPTLPLFVHERLSTKAIIETLTGHKRDMQLDLFGDPQRPIADQLLKAYEHRDQWTNRMILGDSLVVMNSLLHYEGLGGQVQTIYVDPPYGVKFGSNFQPFVRRRDVEHNDDGDMTREPEMVKAYRDTWTIGLHSYLSYLRDRLLMSRELLSPTGSVFVQISDENLHHVRELLDEVFGHQNFASLITFQKTSGATSNTLPTTSDYLLWYARDLDHLKFRNVYTRQVAGAAGAVEYKRVELPDGSLAPVARFVDEGRLNLPEGARIFTTDSVVSKGGDDDDIVFEHEGKKLRLSCKPNRHWKPGAAGLRRLWELGRLLPQQGLRIYKRYFEDFPYRELVHVWTDTRGEDDPQYVVQTHTKVLERCILMASDPGDLVLDPTCGSGTTAHVAEKWGRRWITADVSRVPLALARQRLLTATFPWYELKDEQRGPAGGFAYRRHQNANGEDIGGIVGRITLGSLAHDEPPEEVVLVDRPDDVSGITRVTGPFTFEASIPTPVDWEGDGVEDSGVSDDHASFVQRLIEVLRKSPVLRLEGNRTVTLRNVRPPARALTISAEATIEGHAPGSPITPADAVQVSLERDGKALPFTGTSVALVFGPENGAVSQLLVWEAMEEARLTGYAQLIVIGMQIEPNARVTIEKSTQIGAIPTSYVQMTPDVMMGDLLKNMRSSQIFSVCGLPEVKLHKHPSTGSDQGAYTVELVGVDVFDPVTMENHSRSGGDVPAWFLDTDYNGLCFHVCQAFFPRTGAWDNLRKSLRATYDEAVWDHLAGNVSAPFEPGSHKQVAVKVIDDRGNELLVVRKLAEGK